MLHIFTLENTTESEVNSKPWSEHEPKPKVFCHLLLRFTTRFLVVVVVVVHRNSIVSLLLIFGQTSMPTTLMTTLKTVSNRQLNIVVIRLVVLELDSSVLGGGKTVFGVTDFEKTRPLSFRIWRKENKKIKSLISNIVKIRSQSYKTT